MLHGSGPHLAPLARRTLSQQFVAPSRTATPPCRPASHAWDDLHGLTFKTTATSEQKTSGQRLERQQRAGELSLGQYLPTPAALQPDRHSLAPHPPRRSANRLLSPSQELRISTFLSQRLSNNNMNTLGDFPIQASKSIKTSSFSSPRPIVAERSALGTPNLKVWGSILGVFTLFTFAPYLFIAVSFMSCEKNSFFHLTTVKTE